MKVGNKTYKTLWFENDIVKIIDQTKLPFKFKVVELKSLKDFCSAIFEMKVRGAPLIGVTAAFGLATLIQKNPSEKRINKIFAELIKTRPTAVNLKWALNLMKKKLLDLSYSQRSNESIKIAKMIMKNEISASKSIGRLGCDLIKRIFKKKKDTVNILTHCNAGWLATIDWGTALAPIYMAKRAKIPIHVWVDETRPRNQGALLTAWELDQEKIPYTIIVDNAGGHLMSEKKVDMCLVGSDRTASNGDVCNKIGTYLKAIAAFENLIPFYVALPSSTIDMEIKSGKNNIIIEERSGLELSNMNFIERRKIKSNEIYFKNAKTYNPAFDITPAKYITKLITEKGICNANKKSIKTILNY